MVQFQHPSTHNEIAAVETTVDNQHGHPVATTSKVFFYNYTLLRVYIMLNCWPELQITNTPYFHDFKLVN